MNYKKVFSIFLSIFALLLAILGQNSFIGVFTEELIKSVNISYTIFGILLTCSTLVSAYFIYILNKIIDSQGFRSGVFISITFGICTLIILANLNFIKEISHALILVMILGLALTGLRFSFRGFFRIISTTITLNSFKTREVKKAFALIGLIAASIASTIPYITYKAKEISSSQVIFIFYIGLLIVFIFCLVIFQKIFNFNFKNLSENRKSSGISTLGSISLHGAKKHLRFWIYMIGLPFYSLLLSSVILFLEKISQFFSVPYETGLALNLVAALVGIPIFIISSMKIKYSPIWFLLYLSAILLSFFGFFNFDQAWARYLAFACFGVSSALYTSLSMNLWATVYGLEDNMRFLSANTTIDLIATAIGPAIFAVLIENFSIPIALKVLSLVLILLLVLFIFSLIKGNSGVSHRPEKKYIILLSKGTFREKLSILCANFRTTKLSKGKIISAILVDNFMIYWNKSKHQKANPAFNDLLLNLVNHPGEFELENIFVYKLNSNKLEVENIDLKPLLSNKNIAEIVPTIQGKIRSFMTK